MQAVQAVRLQIWQSIPGTVLLYGAFLVHILLSLKRVARRRFSKLPAEEALQIVMGLLIPYLLIDHLIGTRLQEQFGYRELYSNVLRRIWESSEVKQTILVLITWTHGCIGIAQAAETFKRVSNILDPKVDGELDPKALKLPAETQLLAGATKAEAAVRKGLAARQYGDVLDAVGTLRGDVAALFDAAMGNDPAQANVLAAYQAWRQVVPTVKRLVVAPWERFLEDANRLRAGLAKGKYDAYLLMPRGKRDEEFHTAVCELLSDWGSTVAQPEIETVRLVTPDQDALTLSIRDFLDRMGMPHRVYAPDTEIGSGISAVFARSRYLTNAAIPPS